MVYDVIRSVRTLHQLLEDHSWLLHGFHEGENSPNLPLIVLAELQQELYILLLDDLKLLTEFPSLSQMLLCQLFFLHIILKSLTISYI